MTSPSTVEYRARTHYQNPVIAENYDRRRFLGWRWQLKQRNQERTLAKVLAAVADGGIVLDLPTGTGRFLPFLERIGKQWIAADISALMLQQARRRASGLARGRGFTVLDATKLPFTAGSVDCVLAMRFIQHIPDALRPAILGEFNRITKRWLVIEYKLHNPLRALSKRLRARPPDRVRNPAEVEAELAAAGFVVRCIEPVSRLASTSKIYLCERSPALRPP